MPIESNDAHYFLAKQKLNLTEALCPSHCRSAKKNRQHEKSERIRQICYYLGSITSFHHGTMVHLSVNENAMAPMANAIAIETKPEQLHSQHVRVNWHKSNSFSSLSVSLLPVSVVVVEWQACVDEELKQHNTIAISLAILKHSHTENHSAAGFFLFCSIRWTLCALKCYEFLAKIRSVENGPIQKDWEKYWEILANNSHPIGIVFHSFLASIPLECAVCALGKCFFFDLQVYLF